VRVVYVSVTRAHTGKEMKKSKSGKPDYGDSKLKKTVEVIKGMYYVYVCVCMLTHWVYL
jgi:hypothetical protein